MDTFVSRMFGRVTVQKHDYADGNLAIQLYLEDGEDLATLSVNLPEHAHHLRRDEFFVKTYSENAEIAREALASGLFVDTGVRIPTGIGPTPVWRCH